MSEFKADLHVHTSASPDGRSAQPALAAAARARGLHALAVTDHNLCTPAPAALDGVLLIPGCEVSTQAGHITALFLERPLDLDMSGPLPPPEAAVEAIHRCGGLAVLAHPFQRPGAKPEDLAAAFDGVETANARAAFKVPDANEKAAGLARRWALPCVGGSDAHDAAEVGNAYTVLTADALTLPALRQAAAAGGRAVLCRNTPHFRKGLSQWTKARRAGWKYLPRAALYAAYCAALDICNPRRSPSCLL